MLLLLILAFMPVQPAADLFDGAGKTTCFIPEGKITAELQWKGKRVIAREGALHLGDTALTGCNGLPGAFPTALATAGDTLWVGFRGEGVHAFDGKGFTKLPGLPVDGVRAMAFYNERLWIGMGVKGLYTARDGKAARRFKHWILGRKGITGLAASGASLEVGVGPYGWWRIDGSKARRVEKRTFAGCFVDGAALAPVSDCALGDAPAASGLPSGHITTLARHQGILYVGTFDGGLARQEAGGFAVIKGAPRFINALLSVDDTLWIATPRGLFTLDARGVQPSRLPLPSTHINALTLGSDGTLWVATSKGLAGFGPKGSATYTRDSGLPGRIVYSVAATTDGAIWAGTDRGAARIGPAGITLYTQANGALPHDWVNALLAQGEAVYAGTYDAGVVLLRADGNSNRVKGLHEAWVNPGGLAYVGGRLAVSTLGDGFLSVGGGGSEAVVIRQTLPSQDVTAALWHNARLYVGTRGGLVRVE